MENKVNSYKFEYILCDGPNPEDWASISLEELQKLSTDGKAIVFNFGGNGTKSKKTAVSYGKTIRTLLGVNSNLAHVISVNYNESTGLTKDMHKNVSTLVEKVFKPMFYNPCRKITLDQANRNFRKFTIFAHCHGAFGVLESMEDELDRTLRNYTNFNSACRAELLSQIVCSTYGSTTDLKYFTEFNCTSYNDNVKMFEGNAVWDEMFKKHFDEVDIPPHEKAKLYAQYQKHKRKNKEMLTFVKRYLNKNDRIFMYKERNNKVVFATGHLTNNIDNDKFNTSGGDHLNVYMRYYYNKSLTSPATVAGEYMTRVQSCILCSSVANSYRNLHSMFPMPFSADTICKNISNFVSPLNYAKELNLSSGDMYNLPPIRKEDEIQVQPNRTDYPDLFEKE